MLYKRFSVIAVILLLIQTSVASSAVQGNIKSVILYQNGAMVTKEIVSNSKNIEVFLPDYTNVSSIRIQCTSPPQSMHTKRKLLTKIDTSFINNLQEKLKTKRAMLNKIESKISANRLSIYILKHAKIEIKGEKYQKMIESIKKYVEMFKLAELNLKDKSKKLKEEISVIEKEIEKLNNKRDSQLVAEIRFKDNMKKRKINLIYFVKNAGWRPSYNLFLNNGKLHIEYSAEIWQKTGEDWKDVKISLATKRQTLPKRLPKPYIIRADIAKKKTVRVLPYIKNFIPKKAMVKIQKELVGVRIQIPKKVNIPSDGSKSHIPIYDGIVPANIRYITIPYISKFTFIRSRIRNNTQIPWIEGKAIFFAGKELLKKGYMKTLLPGEEREIDFGVDEGITAIRIQSQKLKGSLGIISKQKEVEYTYTTVIKNNHSTKRTISIIDVIPISVNKLIKVTDIKISPKAERFKSGLIKWKVSLAQHSSKTLSIHYKLVYPIDKELKLYPFYQISTHF